MPDARLRPALDPAVRGEDDQAEPGPEHLGEVELFTVIATLDVTAANLAIETFLPMNPESAARLDRLSVARSA